MQSAVARSIPMHQCSNRMTSYVFIVELDSKVVVDLAKDIKSIADNKGEKKGMLEGVFSILKKMYDAGVFRIILKVFKEMDYFEWIKLSLIVIANTFILVSTGSSIYIAIYSQNELCLIRFLL